MAELERVTTLWFHDGNVVVKAGLKIFKVYSGILAQRSTTFKTIFATADPPPYPGQPAAGSSREFYDQCPLIRVDDDPDDMELWMRAIFDPSYLRSPSNLNFQNKTIMSQLISLARSSEKYGSPGPKRICFAYLDSLLPTNLGDVDKLWAAKSNAINPKDAPSLIFLCHEAKADWLVPSLYYLAAIEPSNLQLSSWSDNHPIFETFLLGVRRQCLQHPLLMNTFFQDTNCNKCAEPRFQSVKNYNDCLIRFASDATNQQAMRLKAIQTMDPLRIVAQRFVSTQTALFETKLCPKCKRLLMQEYEVKRQSIWNRVPDMYGFEEWPLLRKGRENFFKALE